MHWVRWMLAWLAVALMVLVLGVLILVLSSPPTLPGAGPPPSAGALPATPAIPGGVGDPSLLRLPPG